MKRHITTLGECLAHPLRPLFTSGLLFAAVCAVAVPYNSQHPHNLRVTPNYVTLGADGTVAGELIAENDCWRGRSPRGVSPTRAVVELDPRRGPVLEDAATGFGIWLDGAPGTLYAFCR